jgi:Lon protease-like protein
MSGTRRYLTIADLPPVLPVFPLTGALLLPHARMPLNIFEPRYLTMVDAAMDGARMIGMIQPREPGEEMTLKPALANVGCAGRIVSYAETEDGRYLITLAGIVRFRVARELEKPGPFRQVQPDYAPYTGDLDLPGPDLDIARERLTASLRLYMARRNMQTDWQAIAEAPVEPLINTLSMICPFEPAEKQALLEASDLRARADVLIALIEMANAGPPPSGGAESGGAQIN